MDEFIILIMIFISFCILSVAIEVIKDSIKNKKYKPIIWTIIIAGFLLMGSLNTMFETIKDTKREYKPDVLADIREKASEPVEFDVNSVPDEEGLYKTGKYIVGGEIEAGSYELIWIGGSSVVYCNNIPIFGVENEYTGCRYDGLRLNKGDVVKIPDNTAVKFLRNIVLGEND